MPAEPTRRLVLAASALAAAGLAGCGRIHPWSVPPKQAPDVGTLAEAIAAEQAMISRYASVLTRFPGLGPGLTPVLDQHREHLAALRGRLVVPPGTATPSARPAALASRPPVLPSAAAAVAYLRTAEEAQAAAMVRWLPAAPPSLAQLLASIGASEASHAAILRAAGRPG